MIVLVLSHERARALRGPEVAAPACGARWGKAAVYGFDRSDAEIENEARGGINTVERSSNPSRIKLWNLSTVWRAYEVVEAPSSDDPAQTLLATPLYIPQVVMPLGVTLLAVALLASATEKLRRTRTVSDRPDGAA